MIRLFVALFLLLPVMAEAKEIVIPYNDFLTMVSRVEHKEKLLKQCAEEREILVKLNDEHGTITRLNAQQVDALANEIKEHEKLGETQEQIIKAMEAVLEEEQSKHKWYAIGGLGVGSLITTLIIMAVIN